MKKLIVTILLIAMFTVNVLILQVSAVTLIDDNSQVNLRMTDITSGSGDINGSIINTGSWIEFDVTIRRSGIYNLVLYKRNLIDSKVKVTFDNLNSIEQMTYSRYTTIGSKNLNNGLHKIKMEVISGSLDYSHIRIICADFQVWENVVNKIEAEDFVETDSNIRWYVDVQSSGDYASTGGYPNDGAVYFSTGNKYSLYHLIAPNNGLYRLSIYTNQKYSEIPIETSVYVNDRYMGKGETQKSELNQIEAGPVIIDNIILQRGLNKLKLVGDKIEGVRLYYFELTRMEYYEHNLNIIQKIDLPINRVEGNARYFFNADISGKHMLTITYISDAESSVSVEFNAQNQGSFVFGGNRGKECRAIISVLNFNQAKNVLTLFLDDNAEYKNITIYPITEKIESMFINDINSSKDEYELAKAMDKYKQSIGTDIDGTLAGFVYSKPVYMRMLRKSYNAIEELISELQAAKKYEWANPVASLYKNNQQIYSLESGDVELRFNTKILNLEEGFIFGAIYKNNTLYSVDLKDAAAEYAVLKFNQITIDEQYDYQFKIFILDNPLNIKPINPFKEIYKEIYVSDKGDDSIADGSASNPFYSIERANEEVRLINENQWGDIIVNVDEGIYKVDKMLAFEPEDSGYNGFDIIYRGVGNSDSVISGGERVLGWTQYNDNLWRAPINDAEEIRNLYINNFPATRARDYTLYQYESTHHIENSPYDRDGIVVNDFPDFERPEDIELVFNWEFVSYRLPVKSISKDGSSSTVIIEQPIFDTVARIQPKFMFYVENAMELLDDPGEFYYNKQEKMLYYYPLNDENMQSVEAYIGDTEILLSIEGHDIDNKVHNVKFENLAFRYGAWNYADKYGNPGGQSDGFGSMTVPDGSELATAQLRMNNAKDTSVTDCEFSCLGSVAVSMNDSVSDVSFTGNVIRDVSGTGLIIGNPVHRNKQKGIEVCSNIEIKNNAFIRVAQEFYNNCVISVYYENNIKILHNYIEDAPYTGITVGWGWEGAEGYDCGEIEVAYNKIKDVMSVLNDGGGIYTLGKLKNTFIHNNYITKSVQSNRGVYLDAGSACIECFKNVIIGSRYYLQIQKVEYLTHDINVYDMYSDTSFWLKPGISDSIYVENVNIINVANLTGAAKEIHDNSGLEPSYIKILNGTELPSGRNNRSVNSVNTSSTY